VYVKKWVDYSNKFGIAYYLSNGSYGVHFNDESKMVLKGVNEELYFLCKENGQGVCNQYTSKNYPKELQKKF